MSNQINTEFWTGQRENSGSNLVSLKDILDGDANPERDSFKSYIHVANKFKHQDGSQESDQDRQIIVTRLNIDFNNKDCKLVTFTDITFKKKFEQQEEKSQLLATLNASVHHELITPLNINVHVAE